MLMHGTGKLLNEDEVTMQFNKNLGLVGFLMQINYNTITAWCESSHVQCMHPVSDQTRELTFLSCISFS